MANPVNNRTIQRLVRLANLSKLRWQLLTHPRHQYDPVIWIIGDGRSGSTWLMELVSDALQARTIVEPFHPDYSPARTRIIGNVAASQAADVWPAWRDYMHGVFSGRYCSYRQNLGNRYGLSRALVIKDIHASLVATDLLMQFPQVKPIFILRHPLSVVLSKSQRSDYRWHYPEQHLQSFLTSPWLAPQAGQITTLWSAIERSNSPELQSLFWWFVINIGALKRLQQMNSRVAIVCYESLLKNTDECLEDLLDLVGADAQSNRFIDKGNASLFSRQMPAGPGVKDIESLSLQGELYHQLSELFQLPQLYSSTGVPIFPGPFRSVDLTF
jgi:hypothetical protein